MKGRHYRDLVYTFTEVVSAKFPLNQQYKDLIYEELLIKKSKMQKQMLCSFSVGRIITVKIQNKRPLCENPPDFIPL